VPIDQQSDSSIVWVLPEPYPPSVIESTSILRERWNHTHPRVIPSVNTRQNRDERLHISRVIQGSSSKISFDQVVGILRRALLGAMQSDPGHLCQVVHREKFQSCVRSVFIFYSTGNASAARLRVGVLLMSKCAVKPAVALTGIPIEVANVSRSRVTTPSRPSSGCGRSR
jgi:hypothetical protein